MHASCVAIYDVGILFTGPSGSGKSDLALRLIDRGARLIGDDQIHLKRQGNAIMLEPVQSLTGKIEVRSLGIYAVDYVRNVPLICEFQLSQKVDRFPLDRQSTIIFGLPVPSIKLLAYEASAPIKVEMAVRQLLQGRSAE